MVRPLLFVSAFLLAVALALLPLPAHAWGPLGHRLVALLAWDDLTPQARRQVEILLRGEPDPTLAGIASWADDLRKHDPVLGRTSARWHFVNLGEHDCAYEQVLDCPGGNCVVEAIRAQAAILANPERTHAERLQALKFVVHFVGDVHQPMHAGDRPDAGGNGFQISLTTPIEPEAYARAKYVDGVMGTNLHSVWDYYILASNNLSLRQYSDRLDKLPWPPYPVPSKYDVMPLAWAGESCRLIDARGLYPPEDRHTMDHAYLDAMRPLAEQRVRQAAWRLAQLLNQSLGEG